MTDPMRKIMKLFLTLSEEEKSWEEVRPMCDSLFHDEVRMTNEKGECFNKERIMADMEELVNDKATMELGKVEDDHELGINYEYIVRKPRQKSHRYEASAMVRDGKLYHVNIADTTNIAHPMSEEKMKRESVPVLI